MYRDGVMAADSRCTRSEWAFATVKKVYRRDDGALMAASGGSSEGRALLDWAMGGHVGEQPKGNDASLLLVHPNGNAMVYEAGSGHPLEGMPFIAIGSGFPVALGALHMGATAVEAVTIAAKVDPSTGGDVTALAHDGRTP